MSAHLLISLGLLSHLYPSGNLVVFGFAVVFALRRRPATFGQGAALCLLFALTKLVSLFVIETALDRPLGTPADHVAAGALYFAVALACLGAMRRRDPAVRLSR